MQWIYKFLPPKMRINFFDLTQKKARLVIYSMLRQAMVGLQKFCAVRLFYDHM